VTLQGDARRRFAARHAWECGWWAPHCRKNYRCRVWGLWLLVPWYCKLCVPGRVVEQVGMEGNP
jgi:hypothetical protein